MSKAATAIIVPIYLIAGFVQLFAIMAGLEEWIGIPWFIAGFLALFITYMPLVGSVVGMFGAVEAWGWSWFSAGALFFGWFAVILLIAAVMSVVDRRSAT